MARWAMAAGAGLALVLAAATAWCAGAPATIQTEGLSISLATTPNPPARHEGTAVEITIQDAAGKPVGGARLSLDLTMPAHRTMAEQGPRVHERGEGRYVATAAFSMGGEWLVIVDVLLTNGRRARAEFPLRVR